MGVRIWTVVARIVTTADEREPMAREEILTELEATFAPGNVEILDLYEQVDNEDVTEEGSH